jgi:hypothetical protein
MCSTEFRGHPHNQVEVAITKWLGEFYPNAKAQVKDLVDGAIPDIVFSYRHDQHGVDLLVVLEAKPVWQRWIAIGDREYSGTETDECGRTTGNYAGNNIRQVVQDRDKLLSTYTDPRDRLLLLALVFQRPGELDEQLIRAVGDGWEVRPRHVVDRCSPPGDNIGMTGMVFWPNR